MSYAPILPIVRLHLKKKKKKKNLGGGGGGGGGDPRATPLSMKPCQLVGSQGVTIHMLIPRLAVACTCDSEKVNIVDRPIQEISESLQVLPGFIIWKLMQLVSL